MNETIFEHTQPILSPAVDGDDGEDPLVIVKREAGIGEELASALVALGKRTRVNDVAPYDYNLSFSVPFEIKYSKDWRRLRQLLRHEARFFGRETQSLLHNLIGDVETIVGGLAIRTLNTGTTIFRGRLERAAGEAARFFETPEGQLIPPPPDKATPGRMNAAGIRVFFGALTEELCVAELRPPLRGRIVTGRFSTLRPMRVLDLGNLGSMYSGAYQFTNIFDPEFVDLTARLDFLRSLEDEIARPVLPFDEVLDYVATQVVAEYVVHVVGLDGIAYRSPQSSSASQWGGVVDPSETPNLRNVALFGSARLTEGEPMPTGTSAGLRFESGSQHMINVKKVSFETEDDVWAHYEDASSEEEQGVS